VLAAGTALIVATNLIALGGVMYNRSGAPDSGLALSQRELNIPYNGWGEGDNSGLALRLVWRVDNAERIGIQRYYPSGETTWLNSAKLAELGISVRKPPGNQEERAAFSTGLPADVLLVLELNGPAYRRRVERSCQPATEENARKRSEALCASEMTENSRLFVVDAGRDRDALRRKYPDTHTYAITHGRIHAAYLSGSVTAWVDGLAIDELHVPITFRTALNAAAGGAFNRLGARTPVAEKFEATVAYGRRLEPWLVSMSAGGT
jgi:hypothetical protein